MIGIVSSKKKGKSSFRQAVRRKLPQACLVALIVAFFFVYFMDSIFITIGSGEAGVFYRRFFGGTVTDRVYGEGLHVIFPWDKMYVYNIRVQETEVQLTHLDKYGLPTQLKISIRYHPERDTLTVLHQLVGPDYLNVVVVPEVVAVVRKITGTVSAEEIYSTAGTLLEDIISKAMDEVSQRYVKIDDVVLKEVQLPPLVEAAIAAKMEQKEIAQAFEYRLLREQKEAERKKIEANGWKEYHAIVTQSLTPEILQWEGVSATKSLANSTNAKMVVIGNGPDGLPVILSTPK